MFGYDALIQVSELRASRSLNHASVKKDWDQFRRWLADYFVKLENMVDLTKQAAIVAASEGRMQYEQLVAKRLAEQGRIQEERVARKLAEKAEQEKIEAEKSETAEVAAIHVPSAISEASSSDARLDAVEQRREKFSEEQEDMKKQLLSHGDMLKLILQKLP